MRRPAIDRRPSRPKVRLVGARCDWLAIRFGVELEPSRVEELERAREDARDRGGATITLEGRCFEVRGQGHEGRRFVLRGAAAEVLVMPGVEVRARGASLLAAMPLEDVVEVERGIAAALGTITSEQVVRLDLAADVAGASLTRADVERFAGRARKTRTVDVEGGAASFYLGQGGPITWCVYDRRARLEARPAAERTAERTRLAEAGVREAEPVLRCELRLTSSALTELDLRDPCELGAKLDGAWAHGTKWARLLAPGSQRRSDRQELDPAWAALSMARFGEAAAAPRTPVRTSTGATLPAAIGVLASALAADPELTREEAETAVTRMLRDTKHEDAVDFARAKLGAAWARIRGVA